MTTERETIIRAAYQTETDHLLLFIMSVEIEEDLSVWFMLACGKRLQGEYGGRNFRDLYVKYEF